MQHFATIWPRLCTFWVVLFREFFAAFSTCYLYLLVCFVSFFFKSLAQWMFVCNYLYYTLVNDVADGWFVVHCLFECISVSDFTVSLLISCILPMKLELCVCMVFHCPDMTKPKNWLTYVMCQLSEGVVWNCSSLSTSSLVSFPFS